MSATPDRPAVSHAIVERRKRGQDVVIQCQCGDAWSHPETATEDRIQDIFRSHATYWDKRAPSKPD